MLQPDGFTLDSNLDRTNSERHHAGKRLDRAIIVILALALGYFSFDKFVLDPERDAELVQATTEAVTEQAKSQIVEQSIAVLPFANLGPDPESEYLADAMTDELIGRLGRIEGVRIKSRQSMARFKGTDQNVREIAALLEVNLVLEGAVRKSGDRVRITMSSLPAANQLVMDCGHNVAMCNADATVLIETK